MTPTADTRLWPGAGYRHLEVRADGHLAVTDGWLRCLLARPEVAPVTESCERERTLHQTLMADPRRPVAEAELAALADPDARENYRVMVDFRDLLVSQPTLENAYLTVTTGQYPRPVPQALLDELVRVMLCHLLGEADDLYRWRAAELLFRPQKVAVEGGVMLADAAYLQARRPAESLTLLQSLIRQAGGEPLDTREQLEVLNKTTLGHYRRHNEAHDLAMSLNLNEPGVQALARVLERWQYHFHGLEATITPLASIDDAHWRWHIGLDAESNRILNGLYQTGKLSDDDAPRLLALFRMQVADAGRLRADLRDYPIYLGLAMDAEHTLRMKPQNLLLNLPLASV